MTITDTSATASRLLPSAARRLSGLAAGACAAALFAASAAAETPMWVIRDDDSTIYLTGTVHMLPPELKWNGPKLDKALEDATELWLEVPMPATIAEMQAEAGPLMMQYALSPGKTLSSRLTEDEQARLAAALERTELPPGAAQGLEMMQPWVVTQMLGLAPLMSSGYDPEAGIDIRLAATAREQGDEVLGFETFEQQLQFFADMSEEQQMEGLRATLAVSFEELDAMTDQARTAFEAWAKGDTAGLEGFISEWKTGDDDGTFAAIPYETLVVNRNKDWAEQIDDMLDRSGVHFIAVGGGHLVGPDSVQQQLKARGITAERY